MTYSGGEPPFAFQPAAPEPVSVPVKHPLLKGGEGTSTYLGCPACPFASPAVMTAGRG